MPFADDPPMRSATVDCPCTPVSGLSPDSHVALMPRGGAESSSSSLQLHSAVDKATISAHTDKVFNQRIPCVGFMASPNQIRCWYSDTDTGNAARDSMPRHIACQ